ncbi:wax ester/triacylglycerol synthase family O-acyltransferase [Streptomyces sp. RB6PN25]|uniref:Diacylglycerol O-acyltransferase n=1 Tax=Streptomyces humicola TaxID=2953240 RepID=A0ABT1PRL3_9ACTN|nr:wax ester/triacylglycerol synthase family O-acyltransferase [Streptomyces humicola]MCQ4079600.1 wax ester/triacylglycerol synthase family O-acyltransferase [Streptomyces humicola]
MEQLSWLDAAFWHLESPTAPLHLGALAVFELPQPLTSAHLVPLISERASRIPTLRRRVVTGGWGPLASPRWESDAVFDPGRHMHLHELHDDGDQALARAAADWMAVPLNPHLPPWEIHLLTPARSLTGGQNRFAILFKAHHAMADGLRTVELGAQLLDQWCATDPPAAGAAPHPQPAAPAARSTGPRRLLGALTDRSGQLARTARLAGSVATASLAGALKPGAHPLHTPSAGRSRLALPLLDLDDVHHVRKQHGATVNDVLLAVITAALRIWLTDHGHCPAPGMARVLVPVSSRHAAGDGGGGNRLSGYLLDLPLGEADPIARLRTVRDAMRTAKDRGPQRGAGAVALLADVVPPAAQRVCSPLLRRATPLLFDALVTNVPLPDVPLSLAGAPLRALYPIAPLAPGQAMAIAMTTYRNTVHLGIRAAGDVDPAFIGQAAHHALAELLDTSG